MNKKGFTTVELITSFSIASVIMLVLFNVIIIMKDNMSDINTKTNMLVAKDNLSYNINKRLKEKELTSLSMCEDGDKCYLFTYSDSTTDKLVYNTDSITFNNYTFEITEGIAVEAPTITEHYDTMTSTTYNGYIIINIPITINNKDYSIIVNKHFNTNSITIDLTDYQYDTNGNKYTPVEYLESTRAQYIDTRYKPNGNTEVEFKYQTPTQNTSQQGLFGARDNGSNRFTLFTGNTKDGFQVDYSIEDHGLAIYSQNIPGVDGTAINVIKLSNYLIINDNKISEVSKKTFQNSLNMFLFANNNNGNAQLPMTGYVWYFKIYDNDTLVRDYIPVLDSSNRPCFFDKVEKECYYSATGTDFLYG